MDYTLSVFNHESNLKDPAKKEGLAKKLGITKSDTTKPLLFSIINSVLNGEQLTAPKPTENKENLKLPTSTLTNVQVKKEESKQGLFGSSNSTNAAGFKSSNIITNFGEKDFEKKSNFCYY